MLSKSEVTRSAILAAARACFAERGLSGTSTRAIAQRAGVTQPLIHHYFGTKHALFVGVLEHAYADYERIQSEQWALPPGDPQFFTRGLVVLFLWLGRNAELLRLGAWARLEGAEPPSSGFVSVYARVREQIDAARQAGVLREDIDTDAVILLIDALFKGYWDRRASYLGGPIGEHELDARMLKTALETLLRGLGAPTAIPELLALAVEALAEC